MLTEGFCTALLRSCFGVGWNLSTCCDFQISICCTCGLYYNFNLPARPMLKTICITMLLLSGDLFIQLLHVVQSSRLGWLYTVMS